MSEVPCQILGNPAKLERWREIEAKAELAFEAWTEGDMPDDLYRLRLSQYEEARKELLEI